MARAVRLIVDTGDPDWRQDLLSYLADVGFAGRGGFLRHHGAAPDGNPALLAEAAYGGVVNLAAELGYRVLDIASGGREL